MKVIIDSQKLKQLEKKVSKDKVQTALRRVLVNSKLTDVADVFEEYQNIDFKFSIDIETLPITNQKQSGRCWIFSGLNFLRHHTNKNLKLKELEFSQNYLAFYDKLEKINYYLDTISEMLDKDIDDRFFQHVLVNFYGDGGQWNMFVNLVKKYGIVPKQAMPETDSSSSTYKMNSFIELKLRKFAADAQKLFKNKKLSEIEELKESVLYELYSFLVVNLGLPPKTVNFEYVDEKKKYHLDRNLTPKEFYDKYVGLDLDQYVEVINVPYETRPFNSMIEIKKSSFMTGAKNNKYLNLELNRFKEVAINQLKDKELIWFGCNVGYNFSRKFGVWDDKLFAYDKLFDMDFTVTKGDSIYYRVYALEHAMVLCGVNLVKGKPNKWKIENSWGSDLGKKGIYLGTDSWFDMYVTELVINKKHLNEQELKDLEKEPILIEAWDPLSE